MDSAAPTRAAVDLVRRSPISLVLLDLATQQVVEASDAALEVFRSTRDQMLGQLATTYSDDKQRTSEALGLLHRGMVEGYQTARRLRRADGNPFDAWVWTRRVPDTDLILLIVSDEPQRRDPHPVSIEPQPAVVGTVDDEWRIASISTDVEDLLGVPAYDVVGTPATGRIHRDDLPELLLTVAECLRTGRSANTGVRFLDGERTWRRMHLLLTPLRDRANRRLAFVLCSPGEASTSEDLAARLRRIAAEVRAAGVLHPTGPAPLLDTTDLSDRQREILERLAAGSRVPAIARDLYLSQSTVRNHLAQVFQKFGVHSQVELLEVLRQRQSA